VYDVAEGSPALGRRFLVAAHKTFALLSTQPEMGCSPKFKRRALVGARIFRIRGFENSLIIYLTAENGIEILRVIHGASNIQRLLRLESE